MSSTISTIQEKYFTLVLDFFKKYYEPYKGKDPISSAKAVSISSSGRILREIKTVKEHVSTFWEDNKQDLYSEISALGGIKTGFHGDISPFDSGGVISKTALYVDTVLIPDPLTKVLNMPLEMFEPRIYVYYLIKHTFNILNSQSIFLSDGEYPISLIYPLKLDLEDERKELSLKEAHNDILAYFSEIFEKNMKTIEEIEIMLKKNDEELVKEIKKEDKVIPHFKNSSSLLEGLRKGKEMIKNAGMNVSDEVSSGMLLMTYVLGRFSGLSDHLKECIEFHSKSLFNEPNGWFLYNWKIQKDSERTNEIYKLDVDTEVINALQLNNYRWLGNIPIKKIKEIRDTGELQDFRDIFRREIDTLYNSPYDELNEVSKQINYNLNAAFKKHQSEVNQLNLQYKNRYKIDGTLLAIGAVGIVAAILWPPAAAISVIGGGGLVDYALKQDEHKEKIKLLKNRPVGILFDAYEKNP